MIEGMRCLIVVVLCYTYPEQGKQASDDQGR
jgi:hypothetical protein